MPPRSSSRTSSPPAPSTNTTSDSAAISPIRLACWATGGSRTPSRRAAASGESGSRSRTSSWVTTSSPTRRRTSSTSPGSPGARPVWAGFTTATSLPRSRTTAARAAVTTVLPTSVPVPVTSTTEVRDLGSATGAGELAEHLAGPVEVVLGVVGVRGEPQPRRAVGGRRGPEAADPDAVRPAPARPPRPLRAAPASSPTSRRRRAPRRRRPRPAGRRWRAPGR